MCPYQQIAALQLGPNAADAAGLALMLLAYSWRVIAQARQGALAAAPLGAIGRF